MDECSLNISANSIAAGCDLTALWPRYIVRINIRVRIPYPCGTYIWRTEHPQGRLYSGDCRDLHAPVEPAQKQQQLYLVPFCLFRVPELDRRCDGASRLTLMFDT